MENGIIIFGITVQYYRKRFKIWLFGYDRVYGKHVSRSQNELIKDAVEWNLCGKRLLEKPRTRRGFCNKEERRIT